MQVATQDQLGREVSSKEAAILPGTPSKTPAELADIVSHFVASPGWIDRVRLNAEQRWYERLYHGPDYDIWVISWMPGQSTGFHDHAESAGAFIVATGVLEEHRPGEQPLAILPHQPRAFGTDYAHDVRNVSPAPAVSIHAYSPPLTDMNEYELDGNELIPREPASERVQKLVKERQHLEPAARSGFSTIDQVLSTARSRLRRLSPQNAFAAATRESTVLVDIRPAAQRAVEGTVPGALIVERNVLEWRFDPTSSARLPLAARHDLQVIVFCSEGYTSSLAAAALQDLGLWRATDLLGGFQAWRAAGLPIEPPAETIPPASSSGSS